MRRLLQSRDQISLTDVLQVFGWVEKTHLRGRLVYFRVRETRAEVSDLQHESLVRKLQIQPDSAFYPWLEKQLARRFDYVCCHDLAQFRREKRPITRAGQIKAPGRAPRKG